MAERVFVEKLERVGFRRPAVVERGSWGIADCARYPLFEPELIEAMRRLIPADRHDEVARCVVVVADKPAAAT